MITCDTCGAKKDPNPFAYINFMNDPWTTILADKVPEQADWLVKRDYHFCSVDHRNQWVKAQHDRFEQERDRFTYDDAVTGPP